MPTFRIEKQGDWWAIVVTAGVYTRTLPLMYASREAAQRGVLAMLGH